MDARKPRRRIIDSSVVPQSRRSETTSYNNCSARIITSNGIIQNNGYTRKAQKPWEIHNEAFKKRVVNRYVNHVPVDFHPPNRRRRRTINDVVTVPALGFAETSVKDTGNIPSAHTAFAVAPCFDKLVTEGVFSKNASTEVSGKIDEEGLCSGTRDLGNVNHRTSLSHEPQCSNRQLRRSLSNAYMDSGFREVRCSNKLQSVPVYIDYVITERVAENKQEKMALSDWLAYRHESQNSNREFVDLDTTLRTEMVKERVPIQADIYEPERDNESSLLFRDSPVSVFSIDSGSTLVCHESSGLFDNAGAITSHSRLFPDHNPCTDLQHFDTMCQKMRRLEMASFRKRKEQECANMEPMNMWPSGPYPAVSGLERKDPHSIELELTEKDDSEDKVADLFEAIMTDYERDRLRQHELSVSKLFEEDFDVDGDNEVGVTRSLTDKLAKISRPLPNTPPIKHRRQ